VVGTITLLVVVEAELTMIEKQIAKALVVQVAEEQAVVEVPRLLEQQELLTQVAAVAEELTLVQVAEADQEL
jgi:hypothetical protein